MSSHSLTETKEKELYVKPINTLHNNEDDYFKYDEEIEETEDMSLIREYSLVKERISKTTYYLYKFPVIGLDEVEFSFSTLHFIDTIINGIKSILKGGGCKSWKKLSLKGNLILTGDKQKLP